jgi:hypothetical protein
MPNPTSFVNSSNQQKFDYDSLHTETSLVVLQQTAEIRTIVKRATQDITDFPACCDMAIACSYMAT